jgi:transcriptional regulator with XRE-family HTH domain
MKEIHGLRLIKLGDFIKEVRQSKNYTQQVLSELADIDIRTLQRIEKGQINLSLNIFIAIINALELDASNVIQKVTEG